ncbi:hypothetical protein J6590_089533 [Homalodisca vitripennis]|nr:hypothetical protein J6590_051691 [Homalodisca vitripennis]KAG8299932.1 hypothetical protein J6590_089533 [Homalodisca vitripennis]
MDYDNLRTSELDRELDAELDSDESTLLFDDDSDDDPTFDPNQASTSRVFSNQGRPSPVFDSDSDSDYYVVPRQPKRPKLQPRSMPVPLPTPRQRAVFSDESDDDAGPEPVINSSDENDNSGQNPEIWEKVSENDGNATPFVHNFCILNSLVQGIEILIPAPQNQSNTLSYFLLPPYGTQSIRARGNNISPHSRLKSWSPVTLSEIKSFIAVILNMGLVRKPTIKSYWSKAGCQITPWFGKMFPRSRFESIVDNSKLPKRTDPSCDGAQKFQPLH